jgi:hypothetical protein
LYPGQKFVALWNLITSDDLMSLMMRAFPKWPTVRYPALIPKEEGSEELVPLAPEVWSVEGLREKREEVGERAWAYVWAPTDETWDARTSRREVMEDALTHDDKLGEVPASCTDYFLGCDPAVAGSGVCAVTAWGLDRRTKQRYLLFAKS